MAKSYMKLLYFIFLKPERQTPQIIKSAKKKQIYLRKIKLKNQTAFEGENKEIIKNGLPKPLNSNK